MILTEKDLKEYQINNKLNLPDSLVNKLLDRFGSQIEDENNNTFEYTEQDIYEQIRKIIQNYLEDRIISKNQ